MIYDGEVSIAVTASVAAAALRKRTAKFTFSGSLTTGKTIKIDTEMGAVTIDDANAFKDVTGELFYLGVGANDIIYADDGASRSLYIRIDHEDRYG